MRLVYDSDTDILTFEFQKSSKLQRDLKKIDLGNGTIATFSNKHLLLQTEMRDASKYYPVLKAFTGQAQELVKALSGEQVPQTMVNPINGLGNLGTPPKP